MSSMSASQAAALWGWAWGALTEYSRLFDQPGVPEAAHLLDDRQERVALVGQLVLDPRRRFRIAVPRDDALVLEGAEALRKRPRTDAGARVLELREAPRPLREVVDEQRRPFRADDLGAGGDRATLVVNGAHRAHCTFDLTLRVGGPSRSARACSRRRNASG